MCCADSLEMKMTRPHFFQHTGKIVARKTDAAEHIHFEEAQPIRVRNLEERFRFEDSQVVHQNVGLWDLLQEQLDTRESAKVRGDASQLCSGETLGNLFHR